MAQDNDEIDTATADDELPDQGGTAHEGESNTGEAANESSQGADGAAADEGGIDISIEGEDPDPDEDKLNTAPPWVREVRKTNREQARLLREKDEEIARLKGGGRTVELGEKPTLESCDFDADRFERDLEAWHERKRAAEAETEKARKAKDDAEKAWRTSLDAYGKQKAELKVKDFEDAEAAVVDTLSAPQQGIIVSGAENPAIVVYALGKNPKKAKELAAIDDPVKFAFAIAKLESQLKVTPRKAPPPPETTVRGAASTAGTVDSNIERLREEARRTGDYTKVSAYNRTAATKKRA